MTDPYPCLRKASIGIAAWSIFYCLIQFGVLGWQTQYVRDRQWEFENRKVPPDGGPTFFGARHPGLYTIYTETPERRRVNALFAIVLVALVLSIVHLVTSVGLLVGVLKRITWLIFVWFFSSAATVISSATYAIVWWAGDIFNEQLTMSVAEFGLSLANCPAFVIVVLYYLRLTGKLTSDKPRNTDPMIQNIENPQIPAWRGNVMERPSWHLLKKLKRQEIRRINAAWDEYEREQQERLKNQGNGTAPFVTPNNNVPQERTSRIDYRPGPPVQRRFSSSPDKSGLRRSRSRSPTARKVYSKRQQEYYSNV